MNPTLNLTDAEVMFQSILCLQLGLDLVNMYIHEYLIYISLLPVTLRVLMGAQRLNTCNI